MKNDQSSKNVALSPEHEDKIRQLEEIQALFGAEPTTIRQNMIEIISRRAAREEAERAAEVEEIVTSYTATAGKKVKHYVMTFSEAIERAIQDLAGKFTIQTTDEYLAAKNSYTPLFSRKRRGYTGMERLAARTAAGSDWVRYA